MSEHEQLLKRRSSTDVSSPPVLNGDVVSSISTTIAMVVHDVVRNICHNGSAPKTTNGHTVVDPCVASVVQSISNNHMNGHHSADTVPKVDTGHRDADDMDTPPRLIAMKDNNRIDPNRYRNRRRKRRFNPIRKSSMPKSQSASANSNGSDEKSRKRRHLRNMDAQIHSSVFAPDRCRLMKFNQRQKNGQHSNGQESVDTVPTCWHASLNDKLLPTIRNFKYDITRVRTWSVRAVAEFVKSLPSCPSVLAQKFRDEEIDGEALLLLTQNDIMHLLNIRLGPAVKIHSAIMILKHKNFCLSKFGSAN